MPYCEFCGENAGALPFKCSYCGGQFCATHRLPESHGCSLDVEFRKHNFIEKQKRRSQYRRRKDLGVPGERSIIGTVVLYLIVIVSSIIAYFFPYYMCVSHYILFYIFGIYPDPHLWTLFTSIFVIYFSNPFEFAYFIVLLICSYYYIRTIENNYGPTFLLFLFLSCSVLCGLLNLFFSLFYFGMFFTLFYSPIGLASGGLLGVNLFLLLDNKNKDWYFFRFKFKGRDMLLFLSIFNVAIKIISLSQIYGVWALANPFTLLWYIYDLFGLIGAVIFNKWYFKKRY